MSDHGPIPEDFVNSDLKIKDNYVAGQMTLSQFENEYLRDLEDAQKKYEGKIKVLKGIEIEYFFGHDEYYKNLKSNLDYMILGQHYMMQDGKCLDSYYHINYQNVLEYSKFVIAGIESKMFEILAHPDVFMYRYVSENNKLREMDVNATKASKAIIEACIKNEVVLEFNLGGIHKGLRRNKDGLDFPYTTKRFWELVSKYKDAKVIIGCDAHIKENLRTYEIAKAKEILDGLNIKYIDSI